MGRDRILTQEDGSASSTEGSEQQKFVTGSDIGTTKRALDSLNHNSMITVAYDTVTYTNTSSTVDTYLFKTGGTGGTTVATLTLTFTDTTKCQISTAVRT